MVKSFRERFPPPYVVEEIPAPGYRIRDATGNEIAFVYADNGRQEVNQRFRMTMAEAKVWAEAIAKLGG